MMGEKRKYHSEYQDSVCFWGVEPAKYVRFLADRIGSGLSGRRVLDLGAGEGKNAVYLARLGADVVAVDHSEIALGRFSQQPGYEEVSGSLVATVADVEDVEYGDGSFDVVVAYGIFHCLDSISSVEALVRRVQGWVKSGGWFVGATFTDRIPPPQVQDYLSEEAFLPEGRLEELFQGWQEVSSENGTITESHPTSLVEHQHSICRLIARKP